MSGILYFFNPSHDEALASDSPYYTPTKAALRMEEELQDFPRLWAERCDFIPGELFSWIAVTGIEPWGWDKRARFLMRKAGAPEDFLPGDETLAHIRRLSSRQTVAELLPLLTSQCEGTFGESHFFTSEEELYGWLSTCREAMLKAPWSCSGRGVFRCNGSPEPEQRRRISRIVGEQGGIEAEPYYPQAHDFAMEFESKGGEISYLGISLFLTSPEGRYLGNIIDSEENLLSLLESLSPTPSRTRDIYNNVREKLTSVLAHHVAPFYEGPLGVDMLLAEGCICPMLELNVRQTMGGVALKMRKRVDAPSLLSIGMENGRLKAQIKNYDKEKMIFRK